MVTRLLHDVLCSPTKPVTIVVVGTLCSGKSTISERLADSLGIVFDPELGDVLRDKTHLTADGHKLGDGSGAMNIKSWDDQVFMLNASETKLDGAAVEWWKLITLATLRGLLSVNPKMLEIQMH